MVSSQPVKADKGYRGHASSSVPSCDYTVSICPRLFCDLWLVLSLLWCEPSRKYSSAWTGLSESGWILSRITTAMHIHAFLQQAHRYPLRTLMLIQFSALFNIFSLCRFFFSFFPSLVHGVWVCQPLPTGLLAGTYISRFHLPRVDSRAKRFSCPWDHCLIKNIACHN